VRVLERDHQGRPLVVAAAPPAGLKVGQLFRFAPGEPVHEVVRVNDCAAYYRETKLKYVEPFQTKKWDPKTGDFRVGGDYVAKSTEVHAISRNARVFPADEEAGA
jgi:hypothetical protein